MSSLTDDATRLTHNAAIQLTGSLLQEATPEKNHPAKNANGHGREKTENRMHLCA